MDSQWDTTKDSDEFITSFEQYASNRWRPASEQILDAGIWQGEGVSVAFWHNDNRTLWVIAPDNVVLETILTEIQ